MGGSTEPSQLAAISSRSAFLLNPNTHSLLPHTGPWRMDPGSFTTPAWNTAEKHPEVGGTEELCISPLPELRLALLLLPRFQGWSFTCFWSTKSPLNAEGEAGEADGRGTPVLPDIAQGTHSQLTPAKHPSLPKSLTEHSPTPPSACLGRNGLEVNSTERGIAGISTITSVNTSARRATPNRTT